MAEVETKVARLPLKEPMPANQKRFDPSMGVVIRVPKTAEIVADQIRKRIIRGELNDGDFLPPEGQLMGGLNISRPTLREAFRILEAENLISIGRGSRTGARVHAPQVSSVSRYAGFVLQSEGTTIGDIFDARLAIEPFVAGSLARKRPRDAIKRLREEAERLTSLVDDARYVDFMVGIAGFHRLLVDLGGNHTLLFLYALLQGVVEKHQVEVLARSQANLSAHRHESMRGIRSFHKLIKLIEAGDVSGAEAHWRLHIVNANKVWVEAGDVNRVIEVLE
jgi:DNA-binding FadR family transcriptional regulator